MKCVLARRTRGRRGDIQDPFSVAGAVNGCQVVFHLCSLIAIPYSYIAPQSYVMTNVLGAVNVMQAALAEGVERVVHTSTSECYGTAQDTLIDEKHPLRGQSPYSASKIGADMIAESYWRSFGLPVATIRPFNTYGPRQSARAVIPTIISQALVGATVEETLVLSPNILWAQWSMRPACLQRAGFAAGPPDRRATLSNLRVNGVGVAQDKVRLFVKMRVEKLRRTTAGARAARV